MATVREGLGFEGAVLECFRFLVEDYGFTCVENGATMVRYESANVGVQVYHGRQSYEIGVEIRPLAGAASLQPPYRLLDVLRLEEAEQALPEQFLQASTADRVAVLVRRAAELTKVHATKALDGEVFYYRRLAVQREERAVREGVAQRDADLRKRADAAWQTEDYAKVVELLGSIQEQLTSAERKKLEMAEKRRNA